MYITQTFIFSTENGDTPYFGGRTGVHGLPAGSGKFNLYLIVYTKTQLVLESWFFVSNRIFVNFGLHQHISPVKILY